MKASVIVIAYNEQKYIRKCIDSILNQSLQDFDLIVVDDGSTDRTPRILQSYGDRLKTIRIKNSGYSTARNVGLRKSGGDLVFFTDADCVADKHWIEDGIKYMDANPKLLAAAGQIKLEHYSIQIGPWITGCPIWKHYKYPATINCVYRLHILRKLKGFNPRYNIGGEDRDLGFKIQKIGKTGVCKMLVTHRKKRIDWKRGLSLIKRHQQLVYLIKDHGTAFPKLRKSELCQGFILNPRYLISVLFPPYLYYWLLKRKKRIIVKDVLSIVQIYLGLVLIRILYWKTAFKERIFLI